MSSIMIQDLVYSTALDSRAMSAVRGGSAWGPDINVNVTLDQQIGQFQQIGVNVLNNNGVIGAGFIGPNVDVAATQWAMNRAVLPSMGALRGQRIVDFSPGRAGEPWPGAQQRSAARPPSK